MRLALLTLLLAASACVPTERVGSSSAAITGGDVDDGDPGVVLVHGQTTDGTIYMTCSGSLIAPRVVLTAAHCFDDDSLEYAIGINPSYDFSTAGASHTGLYPIVSTMIDPAYDSSTLPHPHDLAVAFVGTDLGTPVAYHAGKPDSSWEDAAVRLVGYGKTTASGNDEGTRRTVTTTIASVSADEIVVTSGKQDCGGDSGGPALMMLDNVETIVGVASAATANCQTTGYYGRIDGDIDFIDDAVAGSGSSVSLSITEQNPVPQTSGCSVAPGTRTIDAFYVFAVLALFVQLAHGHSRRRSAKR